MSRKLERLWCPPEFKKLLKRKAVDEDKTMHDLMQDMASEGNKDIRIIKKKNDLFPKI